MLNVRLPEELESRLAEEANRSRRSRSDLVRDAIGAYLAECERRRFMQAIGQAARAIGGVEPFARESRELAEDFRSLENEVPEAPKEYDAEGRWWK